MKFARGLSPLVLIFYCLLSCTSRFEFSKADGKKDKRSSPTDSAITTAEENEPPATIPDPTNGSSDADKPPVAGLPPDNSSLIPGSFSITAPSGTIVESKPLLIWTKSEHAISYKAMIDDHSDCSSPVADTQKIATLAYMSVDSLIPLLPYYACVTAYSADGKTKTADNNGVSFSIKAASMTSRISNPTTVSYYPRGMYSFGQVLTTTSTSGLFGAKTALSENGNTLVVGISADASGLDGKYLYAAGGVYVYTRTGANWVLQQKLQPLGLNARNAEDRFGASIAISGDTIVVGSGGHGYDQTGANPLPNAGAAWVFLRSNGVWSQQAKIVGQGTNGRMSGDFFGSSVGISGDTIAVGAGSNAFDDTGDNELNGSGAVYVFLRSANTWSLQQKVLPSGPNARLAGGSFGKAVDIENSRLVVGSNVGYDESGNNFISSAGTVFVFERSAGVWTQEGRLVASGTNGRSSSQFGSVVRLSGNTVVVGSFTHGYDDLGANSLSTAGAAWVFVKTIGWALQQKIVPAGNNARMSGDYFGYALDIHDDNLIVSSFNNGYSIGGDNFLPNSGSTWLFERTGATWTQVSKWTGFGTNGRSAGSDFGQSVALQNGIAVVGAPTHNYSADGAEISKATGAVFTFLDNAGSWQSSDVLGFGKKTARQEDTAFGFKIAISEDGSTMVIGAPLDDYDENGENYLHGAGAVYVFTGGKDNWQLQQKIVAHGNNARNEGDLFGSNVGIAGDNIVVGAFGHQYDENGLNPFARCGAAFIFSKESGLWIQKHKLIANNGRAFDDHYGESLSISGETIAIGAQYHKFDVNGSGALSAAGAVWVYTRSAGIWALQQKIVNTSPGGRGQDNFGTSVVIEGDTLLIGAHANSSDEAGGNVVSQSGAAMFYTRSGSTWTFAQKIVGSGSNGRMASDYFGNTVALSGDTALIGAGGQKFDASGLNEISNAGAAYVFTFSMGTWTQQQKITPTGTNSRVAQDWFGGTVAILGDVIAVGSYGSDYDADGSAYLPQSGAAYIFKRTGSVWSQTNRLVAADTTQRGHYDFFGVSFAMRDDFVAVGTPWHEYDFQGSDPVINSGAVFVFDP